MKSKQWCNPHSIKLKLKSLLISSVIKILFKNVPSLITAPMSMVTPVSVLISVGIPNLFQPWWSFSSHRAIATWPNHFTRCKPYIHSITEDEKWIIKLLPSPHDTVISFPPTLTVICQLFSIETTLEATPYERWIWLIVMLSWWWVPTVFFSFLCCCCVCVCVGVVSLCVCAC